MTSSVPYRTTNMDPDQPSDPAADHNGERTRPASGPGGPARSADRHGPARDRNADRSAMVSGDQRPLRSWPLLVLAAPAAVAVWSGWVGIGQMTGFGEIRPLPGIWDSLHVDTAVTLPIGVEAYAAFALRAWLTRNSAVSDRTRRFARWSALAALVLGMAGQVAYHLLTQAGVTRAPWEVTTVVSCLPVAVLGMGSALAHLLRSDAASVGAQIQVAALHTGDQEVAEQWPPDCSDLERPGPGGFGPSAWPDSGSSEATPVQHHDVGGAMSEPASPRAYALSPRPPARMRPSEAYSAAARVIATGQRVSRRSLRSAGLHGSNADLGMLARLVRAGPHSNSARAAP
jgi:hypothetical protein